MSTPPQLHGFTPEEANLLKKALEKSYFRTEGDEQVLVANDLAREFNLDPHTIQDKLDTLGGLCLLGCALLHHVGPLAGDTFTSYRPPPKFVQRLEKFIAETMGR